jgi:energy-converting hydrogenase Eha subunit A
VENQRKRDERILDEKYRTEKERIDNSAMSEEQRLRATSILENDIAEERVAIEDEAQAKLMKIKKRAAVMEKAIAITQIIQSTAQGVMKAWAQGGLFGGPIAALIAGLGAAQIALVASTPIPLAEGGIISGPTTALMGEYPSAGGGNPEVVAPLNKLKSMMGEGGTRRIQIYGRLTGNDIYLSNQSESINRLRTT